MKNLSLARSTYRGLSVYFEPKAGSRYRQAKRARVERKRQWLQGFWTPGRNGAQSNGKSEQNCVFVSVARARVSWFFRALRWLGGSLFCVVFPKLLLGLGAAEKPPGEYLERFTSFSS